MANDPKHLSGPVGRPYRNRSLTLCDTPATMVETEAEKDGMSEIAEGGLWKARVINTQEGPLMVVAPY